MGWFTERKTWYMMKMVKGNNSYCQQYCKVIKVFFSAFALVVVVVSYFRVVLL